jgi:hypothetical protein
VSTGVEPSFDDLYDLILTVVTKQNASDLAEEIRLCVARGIVVSPDDAAHSKAIRPMNSEERLAVAIEFLISRLSVPLMTQKAIATLGCNEMTFKQESTSIGTDMELPQLNVSDLEKLRNNLQQVVKVATELGLKLPEIA